MPGRHVIAIDQGTTSSRVVLIDDAGNPVDSLSGDFPQIFPKPGWVEHDPNAIWSGVAGLLKSVVERAGGAAGIAAIGITNQRETTVLWDRKSGEPLHNAIVWQDRRTADVCAVLREEGLEAHVTSSTGLLLDPYFSATKLAWLLDHVDGARPRAERGELCFGTIDSWLIWNLTGGKVHATDVSNAARTMLFDIHSLAWDEVLLEGFDIPKGILPEVLPSQGVFGECDLDSSGVTLPILGVAGDQQAAAFGQACFEPGTIKSTYGTGCFMLANTGPVPARSKNRLLSTIGWKREDVTSYALEGSIFMAGAIVQWLRDQLCLVEDAKETAVLAGEADADSGVYLVPAFVGLGAPYWAADARAALTGLTRGAGRPEVVRAALEAVAFQSRDLIEAISHDMVAAGQAAPTRIRVDGGMTRNDWFLQNLSDHLAMPVERARHPEATALGAGYLAGLEAGVYSSPDFLAANWTADCVFEPQMPAAQREELYAGWRSAVDRVIA